MPSACLQPRLSLCMRAAAVRDVTRVAQDRQAKQHLLSSTYQAMLVAMNDARHDPSRQVLAPCVPGHQVWACAPCPYPCLQAGCQSAGNHRMNGTR